MAKKDIARKLKSVFGTAEGKEVLHILRNLVEFDKATRKRVDERAQMYALGKASVYAEIQELINYQEDDNGQ